MPIDWSIRGAFRRWLYDPVRSLQNDVYREVSKAVSKTSEDFPEKLRLPVPFGFQLPERVVELYLAWLSYREGSRILDIGFANAMPCHRKTLRRLGKRRCLIGLDVTEPTYRYGRLYECAVLGDISAAPFRDGSFDLIWCISTLEHVGMDNTDYSGRQRVEDDLDILALAEILRLLRKGGSALITVPYGKWEDHGWMRNYDLAHWRKVLSIATTGFSLKEWFFKHSASQGWAITDPGNLQTTGYRDQCNYGAAGLAAVYITRPQLGLPDGSNRSDR